MKGIGKLNGFSINRDGTQNITVAVAGEFGDDYDALKDSMVAVEIKKHHPRRSRNANALAWELIDQIAAVKRLPKTEVYRNAIRDVGGTSACTGIRTDLVPIFTRSWEDGHIGRQVEDLGEGSKPGWSNVRIYFGSSEFDTAQMSRLIDNLIQDAESIGIHTIPDEEAERILGKWGVQK